MSNTDTPFDVEPVIAGTPKKQLPTQGQPPSTMEAFLAVHKIDGWDLLLFGDGSGQGWSKPIGWAVATIDRSNKRDVIFGGNSSGTISIAEIEPYVYALRKHFSQHNYKLEHKLRVYIFSDSAYVVSVGNGVAQPTAHQELWLAINYYRQQGYVITFIHSPRNSNPLQIVIDMASKEGQTVAIGVDWIQEVIHTCLPLRAAYSKISA